MILHNNFGSVVSLLPKMSDSDNKRSDHGKDSLKIRSATKHIVVTELNGFDVLLGRGMPILKKSGNSRFRTLIVNYRDEYRSINRHAFKDEIARRIMLTIRVLGGRFLRPIESIEEREQHNVESDVDAWIVIDEEASLLKIKQALRELPWNAEPRRTSKMVRETSESTSNNADQELRSIKHRAASVPDIHRNPEQSVYTSFSDEDYNIPLKRRKLNPGFFEQAMVNASDRDTFPGARIDGSIMNNIRRSRMDSLHVQRELSDMTTARNASYAKNLRMLRQQIAAGNVTDVQQVSLNNLNSAEQRRPDLRMLQQHQRHQQHRTVTTNPLLREELSLSSLPYRMAMSPTNRSNRPPSGSSPPLFIHETLSFPPSTTMNTMPQFHREEEPLLIRQRDIVHATNTTSTSLRRRIPKSEIVLPGVGIAPPSFRRNSSGTINSNQQPNSNNNIYSTSGSGVVEYKHADDSPNDNNNNDNDMDRRRRGRQQQKESR